MTLQSGTANAKVTDKPCAICGKPVPKTKFGRKTCGEACARELKNRNHSGTAPHVEFRAHLDCGCVRIYEVKPKVDDQVWCRSCDGPACVDSVGKMVTRGGDE